MTLSKGPTGDTGRQSGGYEYLLKALLVGDSGVGKSSVLLRLTANSFDSQNLPTIGVDFKSKIITVEGKKVKLFIWDTAGQERFRTLTSSYYRGAQGVVLVYDCTSRSSFNHLDYWLEEVDKYCSHPDTVKVLISNKIDQENVEVPRSEGEAFAMQHAMLFLETSAKTAAGINEAFEELVLKCLERPHLMQRTAILANSTNLGGSDSFSSGQQRRSGCLC